MITKNLIFTILAVLLTEVGFAVNNPKMDIKSIEKKKAVLNFESDTACLIEITFRCEGGEILYQWKSELPQERVKKVFNLLDLTSGKYNVCLTYGENCIFRELNVSDDGISVGSPVQLFKPFFKFSDNQLKLSFLNGTLKNVYLNVYQKDELITNLSLVESFNMQKIFDFSGLVDGDYDVVLSDSFTEHHFIVHK